MTISAKIEKDSIGPNGARLTTFVLTYPYWITQEVLTHREFSRNSSSQRAQPSKKILKDVLSDIARPIKIYKNQSGMQGGGSLPPFNEGVSQLIWSIHAYFSVGCTYLLNKLGCHKQHANRLLIPHSHVSVVFTGSRFTNFFALRYHSAAQPEIQELAKQMFEIYQKSVPEKISAGEWHLPFISDEEKQDHFEECAMKELNDFNNVWLPLIKKSVARCARVSYLNHDKKSPTEIEDFKLYDRLINLSHWSPLEHQGMATYDNVQSGNFKGFIQYRKTFKNEYITDFTEPLG